MFAAIECCTNRPIAMARVVAATPRQYLRELQKRQQQEGAKKRATGKIFKKVKKEPKTPMKAMKAMKEMKQACFV